MSTWRGWNISCEQDKYSRRDKRKESHTQKRELFRFQTLLLITRDSWAHVVLVYVHLGYILIWESNDGIVQKMSNKYIYFSHKQVCVQYIFLNMYSVCILFIYLFCVISFKTCLHPITQQLTFVFKINTPVRKG